MKRAAPTGVAIWKKKIRDSVAAIEPKVLYAHSPNAKLVEYDLRDSKELMFLIKKVAAEAQPQLIHHPKLGSLFGKEVYMRRGVAFFACPEDTHGYFFSSQLMSSIEPSNYVKALMAMVSKLIGSKVNGILVNEYQDGNEYISDHSDDERGLADTGVFAISMGADRTFRIRDKATKNVVYDATARHGQALFMQGSDFQKQLTHEIPKQAAIKTPRMSLTFRMHNKKEEEQLFAKHIAKNGIIN